MKILMVLETEFPPDTRVENEAISLVNAGHEVHLACYTRSGRVTEEVWEGVSIHRKAISPYIYKTSVGALKFEKYFNFWRAFLGELIETHEFDAIHIHDLPLARVGYEMKQRFGVRFILDLHENWPALLNLSEHTKGFIGRLLCSIPDWENYEQTYSKLADKVIVVVEEARERLVAFGVERGRIHVVSNTLNLAEFDFPKPEKMEGKFVLAYGGGVSYHRGLQYVVEAMPFVKESDREIEVWIIGDGRYLPKLEAQVQELGLNKVVRFFGWQARTELLQLISQADVALIPHIKSPHTDNTIPHKLFQYIYAGLPVLSTNCAPLERIINETNSGFIYQDGDVKGLAALINDLIDHPEKLKARAQSKEWVSQKYNWSNDEQVLIEIYA